MKVLLIKASAAGDFKDYKAKRASPSQNIFSTAAELNGLVELELLDETAGHMIDFNNSADLVEYFFQHLMLLEDMK